MEVVTKQPQNDGPSKSKDVLIQSVVIREFFGNIEGGPFGPLTFKFPILVFRGLGSPGSPGGPQKVFQTYCGFAEGRFAPPGPP